MSDKKWTLASNTLMDMSKKIDDALAQAKARKQVLGRDSADLAHRWKKAIQVAENKLVGAELSENARKVTQQMLADAKQYHRSISEPYQDELKQLNESVKNLESIKKQIQVLEFQEKFANHVTSAKGDVSPGSKSEVAPLNIDFDDLNEQIRRWVYNIEAFKELRQ